MYLTASDFPGQVQSEVPLEVESQLLDRLVVGGVEHLLED